MTIYNKECTQCNHFFLSYDIIPRTDSWITKIILPIHCRMFFRGAFQVGNSGNDALLNNMSIWQWKLRVLLMLNMSETIFHLCLNSINLSYLIFLRMYKCPLFSSESYSSVQLHQKFQTTAILLWRGNSWCFLGSKLLVSWFFHGSNRLLHNPLKIQMICSTNWVIIRFLISFIYFDFWFIEAMERSLMASL